MKKITIFFYAFMAISTISPMILAADTPKKPRRFQVKSACAHCREKHLGCDNYTPCRNCLSRDLECLRNGTKKRSKTPSFLSWSRVNYDFLKQPDVDKDYLLVETKKQPEDLIPLERNLTSNSSDTSITKNECFRLIKMDKVKDNLYRTYDLGVKRTEQNALEQEPGPEKKKRKPDQPENKCEQGLPPIEPPNGAEENSDEWLKWFYDYQAFMDAIFFVPFK